MRQSSFLGIHEIDPRIIRFIADNRWHICAGLDLGTESAARHLFRAGAKIARLGEFARQILCAAFMTAMHDSVCQQAGLPGRDTPLMYRSERGQGDRVGERLLTNIDAHGID